MSVNKKRLELMEKYKPVLESMFEVSADDTSVLFDKLIYMAQNRGVEGADVYGGIPADFDYDAFLEDIKALG